MARIKELRLQKKKKSNFSGEFDARDFLKAQGCSKFGSMDLTRVNIQLRSHSEFTL